MLRILKKAWNVFIGFVNTFIFLFILLHREFHSGERIYKKKIDVFLNFNDLGKTGIRSYKNIHNLQGFIISGNDKGKRKELVEGIVIKKLNLMFQLLFTCD